MNIGRNGPLSLCGYYNANKSTRESFCIGSLAPTLIQSCFCQLYIYLHLAEPREPLRKAPREIIPGLKEHLRGSSATTATFSLFCSVIKFSKEGAEGRTDGRTEAGAARRCAGTLAAAFEATGPPQKR